MSTNKLQKRANSLREIIGQEVGSSVLDLINELVDVEILLKNNKKICL